MHIHEDQKTYSSGRRRKVHRIVVITLAIWGILVGMEVTGAQWAYAEPEVSIDGGFVRPKAVGSFASIRGKVLDGGNGVVGVEVELEIIQGPNENLSLNPVITDEDGSFVLTYQGVGGEGNDFIIANCHVIDCQESLTRTVQWKRATQMSIESFPDLDEEGLLLNIPPNLSLPAVNEVGTFHRMQVRVFDDKNNELRVDIPSIASCCLRVEVVLGPNTDKEVNIAGLDFISYQGDIVGEDTLLATLTLPGQEPIFADHFKKWVSFISVSNGMELLLNIPTALGIPGTEIMLETQNDLILPEPGDIEITDDLVIVTKSFPDKAEKVEINLGGNSRFIIAPGINVQLIGIEVRAGSPSQASQSQHGTDVSVISQAANGLPDPQDPSLVGGAFYNEGTLTLIDVTLDQNFADLGGGAIYNAPGATTLMLGGEVTRNFPEGILNDVGGTFTMIGTEMRDGQSFGLINFGTATITDSSVSGNSGTGLQNLQRIDPNTGEPTGDEATLQVVRSTISQHDVGIDNGSTLILEDSTVATHTNGGLLNGPRSGFLTELPVTADVRNTTFSGNASSFRGAAIHGVGGVVSSQVTLNNVTVTDNTAGIRGSLFHTGLGAMTIGNSIIAANQSSSGGNPDCNGTFTSLGYNLFGNVTGCTINGDLTGNQTGVNQMVGPLTTNGGPTQTHALQFGSPAINAANPATPGSGNGAAEEFDQRGIARNPDIGAFEFVAVSGGTIVLSPETATNPVGTEHTVTATVTDADDGPVHGVVVTFTVSGQNAGVTGTNGTDINGEATFTYAGVNGEGQDTIIASMVDADGNTQTSNDVTKDWVPVTLTLAPQSATNPLGTTHTVTGTVQNADTSDPVEGVTLSFEVTTGPNSGFTSGSGLTDTMGAAAFSYTGNGGIGTDTIRAALIAANDEVIAEATVTKSWTPIQLSLGPESATNPENTDHTVTAVVQDNNSDPVEGVTLLFTVLSGPNAGVLGSRTSDSNGETALTYAGSGGIGLDTIQASFPGGGGVFSNTVTKEWVEAPATTTLTLMLAGDGSGRVTSTPAGIDCGAQCLFAFPFNAEVMLTPTADPGSIFEGFSGDAECDTGTVTLQSDLGCTATFTRLTLDIDGNGAAIALQDGLLVQRYLMGLAGNDLITGVVDPQGTRTTADVIQAYLDQAKPVMLDVDGNTQFVANEDGQLILRYLFGVRGPALIANALGDGAMRNTSALVEAFLAGFMLGANSNANSLSSTDNVTVDQVHSSTEQESIASMAESESGDKVEPSVSTVLPSDAQGMPLANPPAGVVDNSDANAQHRTDFINYTFHSINTLAGDPLSLAKADFDEDGVEDVIAGYGTAAGGTLWVYRGNPQVRYPRGLRTPENQQQALLGPVQEVSVDHAPRFLGTGDFNADDHQDMVIGNTGSSVLLWVAGRGDGTFEAPQRVRLPGKVTAFATGEIHRRDGLTDVVVGIEGKRRAKVLIFQSARGAMNAPLTFFNVRDPVSALALGQVDGDAYGDLIVGTAYKVMVQFGWETLGRPHINGKTKKRRKRRHQIPVPFKIQDLALGKLLPGAGLGPDIGLLAIDGAVHVIPNDQLISSGSRATKAQAVNSHELWRPTEGSVSSEHGRLVAIRTLGASGHHSLFVLNAMGSSLHLVQAKVSLTSQAGMNLATDSPAVSVTAMPLAVEGRPIAVLSMRCNGDAIDDVVLLSQTNSGTLSGAMSEPNLTFIVDVATNELDGNLDDAICDTGEFEILPDGSQGSYIPSGECSLNAALMQTEATPGFDAIHFQILGGGNPVNIPLDFIGNNFSFIVGPLIIDGTTQCSTPPCIGIPVLLLSGHGNTVRGLAVTEGAQLIENFPNPQADSGGHLLEDNYFGLGLDGTTSGIGGLAIGAPNNTFRRNVISGNDFIPGVMMDGATSVVPVIGNLFQGNLIGTDPSGTTAVPNSGGIVIRDAQNNTIGGINGNQGNIISGNINSPGIEIEGTAHGNLIQGNRIGTAKDGETPLGNAGDGILIWAGASHNTIGGMTPNAANIISNNGFENQFGKFGDGIVIASAGTENNVVQGNVIGTTLSPDQPEQGNKAAGIRIQGASKNLIGGENPDAGNVIAFNGFDGVQVITDGGTAPTGNQILGNLIFQNSGLGIDLADQSVTFNDEGDVDGGPNNLQNFPILRSITDANSTFISGTLNSLPNETFRLEFFSSLMIDPSGFGEGENFLGTHEVITDDEGNASFMAEIDEVVPVDHLITATATNLSTGDTSEFSAPVDPLIVNSIEDAGDTDPGDDRCDTGNLVGNNPECTLRAAIEESNALPNKNDIRFATLLGNAITISPSTQLPIITNPLSISAVFERGQFVPGRVTLDGTGAGSNANGLEITKGHTSLTGLTIRNFSGNGLQISGVVANPDNPNKFNNWFSGLRIHNNGQNGVSILNSNDNFLGSNRIHDNGRNGIVIKGDQALDNEIDLMFGGTKIFDNGELGIDLNDDGVTANDNLDEDSGPNDLLNFPVLTQVTEDMPNQYTVTGQFHGPPDTPIFIGIFLNPSCDPSGHGEGAEKMHGFGFRTDDFGDETFVETFTNPNPAATPGWDKITAGAVVLTTNGETSEFSNCIQAQPPPPPSPDLSLAKVDDPDPVPESQELIYTLTVTNNGTANATNVTLTDDLPPEVLFVSSLPEGVCDFDDATHRVSCALGTMAPLEQSVITLTTQVNPLLTLDVDGNGIVDTSTDGMLILRYLFGIRGPALVAGTVDPGGTRTTPDEVTSYLDQAAPTMLDVDINGNSHAHSDGLLILRFMMGLRGDALIAGVVDPAGEQTTAADIEAFLTSFLPGEEREITNKAQVAGNEPDPTPDDNETTVMTTVQPAQQ